MNNILNKIFNIKFSYYLIFGNLIFSFILVDMLPFLTMKTALVIFMFMFILTMILYLYFKKKYIEIKTSDFILCSIGHFHKFCFYIGVFYTAVFIIFTAIEYKNSSFVINKVILFNNSFAGIVICAIYYFLFKFKEVSKVEFYKTYFNYGNENYNYNKILKVTKDNKINYSLGKYLFLSTENKKIIINYPFILIKEDICHLDVLNFLYQEKKVNKDFQIFLDFLKQKQIDIDT